MPVYPGAQDFHLQAVDHARHTKKRERVEPAPVRKIGKFSEF